jgi:hypothetical protein
MHSVAYFQDQERINAIMLQSQNKNENRKPEPTG